jgi:hypothetical protein
MHKYCNVHGCKLSAALEDDPPETRDLWLYLLVKSKTLIVKIKNKLYKSDYARKIHKNIGIGWLQVIPTIMGSVFFTIV